MTIHAGFCVILALVFVLRPLCAAAAAPGLELVWKKGYSLGRAGARAAVLADGTIIIGDDSGRVARLEGDSGREVWSTEVGARVRSAPVLMGGAAVLGDGQGRLMAVDADSGRVLWQFESGDEVVARAVVRDEVVYFGSTDGMLYALYAGDGRMIWNFPTGRPVKTRPALFDNMLISTGDTGLVAGIDVRQRRVVWEHNTAQAGLTEPVVRDGAVYCASHQGVVFALSAATGDAVWKLDTGRTIVHDMALGGDTLYLPTAQGTVLALNIRAKKIEWETDALDGSQGEITGPPAVLGQWVLAPLDNGRLAALAAQDGAVVWRFAEDVLYPGAFGRAEVAGRFVLIPNDNDYFYFFALDQAPEVETDVTAETAPPAEVAELMDRARALFAAGDHAGAAEVYRRVLELDPGNVKAMYNLAVCLEFGGGTRYKRAEDMAGAAVLYLRALDADPGFVNARINLGILYSKMGRPQDAVDELLAALDGGDNADARYNLAVIYEKVGDLANAVEHWRAYLKLEPDKALRKTIRAHIKQLEERR